MSFTNQTTNYGLPQWIAADKPKFLTDINDAYSTIDTQLKNANDTANAAADNATSALSIAGQAATTAEGAATVAGQAAALAQSVNELVGTLNAKMGTTSIATIGDGTVTGAIDALNTGLNSTNNNLNDLSTEVDKLKLVKNSATTTTDASGHTGTLINTADGNIIIANDNAGNIYLPYQYSNTQRLLVLSASNSQPLANTSVTFDYYYLQA